MVTRNIAKMDDIYYIVQGRYGFFWADIKDIYLGKAMIEYGEYSENEVSFLKFLLKEGGQFIDIGAHAGYVAIPLAMHVGKTGRGYAFEPQSMPFNLLKKNVDYNKIEHLSIYNFGIADQEMFAPPFLIEKPTDDMVYNIGGVSFKKSVRLIQKTDNDVKMFSLDSLTIEGPIDLIKIDVEGMELSVLKGSIELIRRDKPHLYLEWFSEDHIDTYRKFLKPLGYSFYKTHMPYLYNSENYFENQYNLYPNIVSKNVIFIHEDKFETIEKSNFLTFFNFY